jgi:HAD superfamily hydrolase (TIGR01549 family)
VLGGAVAAGGDHLEVFARLGVADWEAHAEQVEATFGGFRESDLYPDARRGLDGLRAAGYRLAVVANQPASRDPQLRALGIGAEVMAMSGALGVAKPDPVFFDAALRLMGGPAPGDVAYVGDRVDNDVLPAAAAGMRAVHLVRGPWGYLRPDVDGVASLVVGDLDELVARIDEAWS